MWRSDVRKRNHRCGESRFIERQVKGRGSLHGPLCLSVTTRHIAKRQLRRLNAGVQRIWHLQLGRSRGLPTLRRKARLVFRSQDFRAPQIIFRVNVPLRLLLARTFLACGFRSVLRFLGAALRRTKEQTRAKQNVEATPKRLAEGHLGVHVSLAETGEVSLFHWQPNSRDIRWRNTNQSEAPWHRHFCR